MAKKKFDTNPLDPEFPQKISEARTEVLPNSGAETRKFAEDFAAEPKTRKFATSNFDDYQSPFDGQNIPQNYQAAHFADVGSSSKRKVAKVGLPENIMTAVPYLPFWIGLVAGILTLVFVPKSEAKVRFHAAQGLAVHIGILLVWIILDGLGNVTNLARAGGWVFSIVTTIMLIIWTIKAFRGKPVHIESVDDLTDWLEDKIKPRS